ncbi:MAG: thioredoxin family protein [Ignavibacterium sp.]|nr:MAG: thioredoxin family protein [Ignavibacterium sp.]
MKKKNSETSTFKDLLNSSKPMLIEVKADWCGGSHIIAPIIQKIEQDFGNRVMIERIDYESNKSFLMDCGIENVPSIMLVKDGKIYKLINGTLSKRNLEKLIDELLNNNNHKSNN